MISSIVWLILLEHGLIKPEHAPWFVYIPLVVFEIIIYIISIPKFCDWVDEKRKK